eukprot:6188637-Pleurochrysis_carterae.AAC.4
MTSPPTREQARTCILPPNGCLCRGGSPARVCRKCETYKRMSSPSASCLSARNENTATRRR